MQKTEQISEQLRPRGALIVAVVALVLVFGAVFLWRGVRTSAANTGYAPPPVEVSTTIVKTESLPQALEATGTLSAVREVLLAPEVPGRVTRIHFEAGQQVGQGATLLQLFDAPERADRAAALSKLRFAEIQYKRSRDLAPTGAEPRELLQQREAELAQARAQIRQLDARIAQKVVRAPFSGEIGIRRVNPGQYVNAGDPLATLTALDQLYVNFGVPQQELAKLHVGGTVSIRSDAIPGETFNARINAIEPKVSGDTRNVSVQATLPNSGRRLRPGLYVSVGVTQQARGNAILVPSTAIQTSSFGDSVYVVRDGKAALLPVTLGSEVGERTLVEKGLSPGDVVVTTGQLRLQPGAAVNVTKPAAATRSARPAR